MPALKVAEIVIVVVAGVAFYVWQMRSLKRDRAETARQMAAEQARAQEQTEPCTSPAPTPPVQSAYAPQAASHGIPTDRSRPA